MICLEHLFKKGFSASTSNRLRKIHGLSDLQCLLKERDALSTASRADNTINTIVIVISPLNALMQNQIEKLNTLGVKAAVLGVSEKLDKGNTLLESE